MDVKFDHEQLENATQEAQTADTNNNNTAVLVALIVGLIILVLFFVRRRSKGSRQDFLLCGLCESGKTPIFMQILHDKQPITFTSISENVGDYQTDRGLRRLVDVPGHYRVRQNYFDKYKHTAKGVVLVVDSATVQKEIRDVADAFYSILTDAAVLPCRIAVFCNKQDLDTAKSADTVKVLLEKELDILREVRNRSIDLNAEETNRKIVELGKKGQPFEFSHLPQSVDFCEGSCKQKELDNLIEWMNS